MELLLDGGDETRQMIFYGPGYPADWRLEGVMVITEGKIPYAGFETWYRIAGAPGVRVPLLTLHGGPGAAHDYLTTLDELAYERQIIYYDQIGSGRSSADSAPSRWTLEFFVGELENLIEALDLRSYHLLGQSWGGMLAIAHASRRPSGLRSLILADTPISIPEWAEEGRRLVSEMPDQYRKALEAGEAGGNLNTPEYREALRAFMKKHMLRSNLTDDFESEPTEVYLTMWGDNEMVPTGTMKNADLTPQLRDIRVPTLVLSGRYDQCTETIVKRTLSEISDSRSVVFENSGHIPNIDERDAFNSAVRDFLEAAERAL